MSSDDWAMSFSIFAILVSAWTIGYHLGGRR